MPELKKFKKLYKPLTPEQRQKSVDAAITKRVATFMRMDQRHYRKLTKAAKEAKEFEAKKLRRRVKALQQSTTAQEAEETGKIDLIETAKQEKIDIEEAEEELKVCQKINPEIITVMAFQKLHKDLEKITRKERERQAKEAAKLQADELAIKNAMQKTAGLPLLEEEPVPVPVKEEPVPEPAPVKRERPDESAEDLPKPKKSKKNKKGAEVVSEVVVKEEPAEPVVAVKKEEGEEEEEESDLLNKPLLAVSLAEPSSKTYGQQLGLSDWGQQKMNANATLQSWEPSNPHRRFCQKVMKHAHFNDSYLQVKKIQLQQKAKMEKFKVLCRKHQLLAEQKALEFGLNPPPPEPKKGKKGKKGSKKFFPKLTEEEKLAAKKWKYNKNKERNAQRKREAQQARAALAVAKEHKLKSALAQESAKVKTES